jgi:hypothetical protein
MVCASAGRVGAPRAAQCGGAAAIVTFPTPKDTHEARSIRQ